MIRRPLALFILSLPLLACDAPEEDVELRRGERPGAGSGHGDGDGDGDSFDGEATACAVFLQSLLDDLQGGPGAPPSWANNDVTPGGLVVLGGATVGTIGDPGGTTVVDLPKQCAAIEAELGLPPGYLQPGSESIPGGYVEGCACTDCGMDPDAQGLDTFDSLGLGDAASPHEIYNPQQLADLAESEPAWSRHYTQCADIDLDPYYASGGDEFNIATEDQPFTGAYDGGEHVLSHYVATGARGGIFDTLSGATVENLEFNAADVHWTSPGLQGFQFAGALANRVLDGSRISAIRADGVALETTAASGGCWAGGLLGHVEDSQADALAMSNVDVVGDRCSVAGIIGWATRDTLLTGLSSAEGSVEALSDGVASNGSGSASGIVGGIAFGPRLIGCEVDGGQIQGEAAAGVVWNLQNDESLVADCSTDVEIRGNGVGGLAGRINGGATLRDSHSTGPILPFPGSEHGSRKGGAVGYVTTATLRRVWSSSDISTLNSLAWSSPAKAGGLIGHAGQWGLLQIEESFALGDIDVGFGSTGPVDAGGLIGRIDGDVVSNSVSSFAAGDVEGTTTGAFIGRVTNPHAVVNESFGIGHQTGTGGCFVGSGTINDDGNNYVADTPCNCTVEPGVSVAPLNDFDQPNDNLGFSWSTAVWSFVDGMLPSLQ